MEERKRVNDEDLNLDKMEKSVTMYIFIVKQDLGLIM